MYGVCYATYSMTCVRVYLDAISHAIVACHIISHHTYIYIYIYVFDRAKSSCILNDHAETSLEVRCASHRSVLCIWTDAYMTPFSVRFRLFFIGWLRLFEFLCVSRAWSGWTPTFADEKPGVYHRHAAFSKLVINSFGPGFCLAKALCLLRGWTEEKFYARRAASHHHIHQPKHPFVYICTCSGWFWGHFEVIQVSLGGHSNALATPLVVSLDSTSLAA